MNTHKSCDIPTPTKVLANERVSQVSDAIEEVRFIYS